jgi:hypothetical protein
MKFFENGKDFTIEVANQLELLDVNRIAVHWSELSMAIFIYKMSMSASMVDENIEPSEVAGICYETMTKVYMEKISTIPMVADTNGRIN